MLGNGNANAIFTKTVASILAGPCLAINYSIKPQAGEVPTTRKSKATLTITGGGSTAVLLVTIVNYDQTGTAATNLTYTITGAAAKVAWAGTSPTCTASALTMKEVVDLLNEIPGIQAYVMHCPHSFTINTAYWDTIAVADIPTQPALYLETMTRATGSWVNTDDECAFLRVGVPEMRDAGSMRLVGLDVLATGAASGIIRVYRDDIRNYDAEYSATYATEQANKQMYINQAWTTATFEQILDNDISNAATVQGPLLVAITGDDMTAATATIRLIQASI